jgi:hypothetical protein
MQDETFWRIVEEASRASEEPDGVLEGLRRALRNLALDDVVSFELTFRRLLNEAYNWDLWGAAYVIHGGCSDDGFEYFRRWLVSRGRETYEAALSNPDSLAERDVSPTGPDGCWEFEEFYYVAMEVFEEKGGEGDVRDQSEAEAGLGGAGPSGEAFQEDADHLKARYPKLWQRFGDAPLG